MFFLSFSVHVERLWLEIELIEIGIFYTLGCKGFDMRVTGVVFCFIYGKLNRIVDVVPALALSYALFVVLLLI